MNHVRDTGTERTNKPERTIQINAHQKEPTNHTDKRRHVYGKFGDNLLTLCPIYLLIQTPRCRAPTAFLRFSDRVSVILAYLYYGSLNCEQIRSEFLVPVTPIDW